MVEFIKKVIARKEMSRRAAQSLANQKFIEEHSPLEKFSDSPYRH